MKGQSLAARVFSALPANLESCALKACIFPRLTPAACFAWFLTWHLLHIFALDRDWFIAIALLGQIFPFTQVAVTISAVIG